MAFSLFSRSPQKPKTESTQTAKPQPASPGSSADATAAKLPPGLPPKAVERIERTSSMVLGVATDWRPNQAKIEVNTPSMALVPALENAALLFANGQFPAAQAMLEDALANEADAQASEFCWLAMFDLLQRAGDKATYDRFALDFVVRFERSAPAWEGGEQQVEAKKSPANSALVSFSGVLAAGSAQLQSFLKAVGNFPKARVDVGNLTAIEDDGAITLVNALAPLRKRGYALQWHGLEKLRPLTEKMIKVGERKHEGAWLLLLEILQWTHQAEVFDERAVDYAITFEVSPPSYEPPPQALIAAATNEPEEVVEIEDDGVVLRGVMTGSQDANIKLLLEHEADAGPIKINMKSVDRVDFVCAGALLNAIGTLRRTHPQVFIADASPMVQALLMLVGVEPEMFKSKPR